MILCSWMTTIRCLSFRIQEDAIASRARRLHPHLSRLLNSLWRMTLPLMCSIIYAAPLPRSIQDNNHPPGKIDALMSCHRFIRQHLPTVRMRSIRCMRVLQSHIWDYLPQALTRQSPVLQTFPRPWRQPQRRNQEHASVAIGKAVITKLRVWMIWCGSFFLFLVFPIICSFAISVWHHADMIILFREHVTQHTKCPADNCVFEFKNSKEIERHIWKCHKKWAARTGYHKIDATCSICGNTYARPDFLSRHLKEEHDGQKRKRKSGG